MWIRWIRIRIRNTAKGIEPGNPAGVESEPAQGLCGEEGDEGGGGHLHQGGPVHQQDPHRESAASCCVV